MPCSKHPAWPPSKLVVAAFAIASAVTHLACDRAGSSEDGGESLLAGEVTFPTDSPEVGPVSYTTRGGATVTADAYVGWVSLLATPGADRPATESAIESAGGSVVGALPRVGSYLVEVPPGEESDFLRVMREAPGVLDGEPATPVEPARVTVIDIGHSPGSTLNCDGNIFTHTHGECVSRVVARCAETPCSTPSVEQVEIGSFANAFGTPASMSGVVVREAILAMESAARRGENVVINVSLGSGSCVRGGDLDACAASEGMFLHGLANALEAAAPEVRDRAIIVAGAGNAGADLTAALRYVDRHAATGFGRMRVVGGVTQFGDGIGAWNYSDEHMIFAQAESVEIDEETVANGTSFAAPEVSRVLDLIWQEAPSLGSGELLAAFDEAMQESAANQWADEHVVPSDSGGWTTREFLELARRKAREAAGLGEAPSSGSYTGMATTTRTLAITWQEVDPISCEGSGQWSARVGEDGSVVITGDVVSHPNFDSSGLLCQDLSASPDGIFLRGTVTTPGTFEVDVSLEGTTETFQGSYDETRLTLSYSLSWTGVLAGWGELTRSESVDLALIP